MYGGGGGGYNGGGYGNGYGGGRPVYHDHDDHYNSSDHNQHSNGNSGSHHGGTNAGYHTGESCGRQDHKRHLSANYRRHSGQYDHRTESQFARGYNAGYH